MQERPQYKITPQMGWSQMQPILDKAMPVEHRSRRFIVFWWAAASMIVAISSFILLNEIRQPADLPAAQVPSMEMASNKNAAQSNPSSSIVTNQNNTHTELNDAKSTNINTPGSSFTKSSSTNTTKTGANNNTISHAQQIEPNLAIQAISVTAAMDRNEMVESSTSPVANDYKSNMATENELITSKRNFSAVSFLPLVSGNDYAYTPDQINLVEPAKNTRRNKKFIPNIAMAGMAGSQNGLAFNASLGTDYVINSRFSLTAGAGYMIYHPDVLHLGNSADYQLTEASNALLKDNYLVAEQLNAMADYNAINPFIHSIHQWQVNAGLKYELTHRFFVESGVVLGFKTTAKSEYPIADSNPFTSTPTVSNERSFDSYDIIRSNMTSIYLGGGYKISRRFDVFAQWVHGLDHYLLNDQISYTNTESKRSDYIRGLQIGVKYNL